MQPFSTYASLRSALVPNGCNFITPLALIKQFLIALMFHFWPTVKFHVLFKFLARKNVWKSELYFSPKILFFFKWAVGFFYLLHLFIDFKICTYPFKGFTAMLSYFFEILRGAEMETKLPLSSYDFFKTFFCGIFDN